MASFNTPKPPSSTSRFRRLVVRQSGAPSAKMFTTPFRPIPKVAWRRLSIRRLHKVDVSKGITMPEANNLPFIAGVQGVARGVTRIVRQKPVVPPSSRTNRTVVKTPRPAPGGVRNPYSGRRQGR